MATVSRLKVEKVVKEPSIPMNRNVFHSGDRALKSARPQRRPIAKEPRALTVSVPHGNVAPNALYANPEVPYLSTAPIAPPSAMMARL